jgi:siderophore synthetase component
MGTFKFMGSAWISHSEHHWIPFSGIQFAETIEEELSKHYQKAQQPDFLIQIRDSQRVLELMKQSHCFNSTSHLDFIQSEQSLKFGHPFHPSPKSRLGFSEAEVKQYSPEFSSQFQLFYFDVHQDFVIQNSLETVSAIDLIQQDSTLGRPQEKSYFRIPCHPWQARNILQNPMIKKAIDENKIIPLGARGTPFFATSSVRTVYSPDLDYFLKLSLNVRITNCIRRNTLPELQYSVEVTRMMRSIEKEIQFRYPNWTALEEPAFLTVDLKNEDQSLRRQVTESFSIGFRKGFKPHLQQGIIPILTGALFGNQELGKNQFFDCIPEFISAESWFQQYLSLLLPPIFDLFFDFGIMFEPHLQNTLVGLQDGLPKQFFLRDFDNAKLIEGSEFAQQLKTNLPHVYRDNVIGIDAAWNRLIYCLIVNHLGEAMYQISNHDLRFEMKLWKILRDQLFYYAHSRAKPLKSEWIKKLLLSTTLPAKANLITRFQRTPDSQASYVGIPNPLSFLN